MSKPIFKDDREGDQKRTHFILVGGKDTFMSGWGNAPGVSYAFWACQPEHKKAVSRWVKDRGEIIVKRGITLETELPTLSNGDHLHIYVVADGHPSLKTWEEVK